VTRRERLRRCYSCEELDRPAVYSRTNYPQGDPSYDRLKAYLEVHSELKRGWSGMRIITGPPTETRVEPISEDWERHTTVVRTPAGDLTSSRRVSLRGQPGLPETYLLKTREDAEKYLSLPDPVFSRDMDSFFETDRHVGDTGIVDVGLGPNPGGFVAALFGSENFALMTLTDRDVLHAMCERRMRIILERLRYLLSHHVGPFFSSAGQEMIVPPLHGPRDFDDFNVRYDKPIFDLIHDAGARVHVHCHGSVKRTFPGFLEAGVDVLHPFEAPPMGDLTAPEAKRMARGRICLEGNIQIADMYEATPTKVRRQAQRLIEDCFDDRQGLIVSPTASPYIRGAGEQCFPQYQAMVQAVLEWKP